MEASRRGCLCREVCSGRGERAESGEAGSGFGKGLRLRGPAGLPHRAISDCGFFHPKKL